MSDILRDNMAFLRAFVKEFEMTGTFCPTSQRAARELAWPLAEANRGPKNILEIGAGTGAVTKEVLSQLRSGDKFTICELQPHLVRELQRMCAKNPHYMAHKSDITIFQGPMQELSEKIKYDLIVCSLPFLNFDVNLVEEIFGKLLRLSSDECLMTYVEYIGLRELGKRISPKRRKRLEAMEKFFIRHYVSRQVNEKKIWLNAPPIQIFTLNMAA